MTQDFLGTRRDAPTPVATMSDSVAAATEHDATLLEATDDAATTPRHRFTMTVEDVASRLHQYGLDRDARTIQRWCKSGKISAILDHANGDRWLIDPGTLQPVIDDILEQTSRQPQPFSSTPRQEPPLVADTETSSPTKARVAQSGYMEASGIEHESAATSDDKGTTSPYVATTSADHDDIVATLKKQVAYLESKLALQEATAEADKTVREQMIEYQRTEFGKWIDDGMQKAEQIGELKAEVQHLRKQLPAPIQTPLLPSDDDAPAWQPDTLQRQKTKNLESYETGYPQVEDRPGTV